MGAQRLRPMEPQAPAAPGRTLSLRNPLDEARTGDVVPAPGTKRDGRRRPSSCPIDDIRGDLLDYQREIQHTMRMGATAEVFEERRYPAPRAVVVETDEDLVVAVRAGVDAAFEEIYDRYARGLLSFCVHMLKSREAAEDALQLTFVSAYRAMRDGTSEIVLRPWLYTIARNRCLSEIRARHESEPWTTDPRPQFSDLSDQVQRREDLRDMVDEVRRLPDDQRAALVLFELGDNSHQEIAEILGVQASKVKALVFQAREALARGRLARDQSCADIR